jgi:hypothetical protein
LKSHAVTVADEVAKANLFSVPDGYVVPVTFGGDAPVARVELRHLDKQPEKDSFQAMVRHPGSEDWAHLTLSEANGVWTLDVPLERGCAMVKVY